MANLPVVTDPADPNRCQGIFKGEQCMHLALENSNLCELHNPAHQRTEVRRYRAAHWAQRITELANDPKVKTIRDEIGILRMMLDTVLSRCHDDTELMLQSSHIADLTVKLEKLVVSCDRLEHKMGLMLDKSAALSFAGEIVEIIGKHVTDPSTVELISNDIIDALTRLTSKRE